MMPSGESVTASRRATKWAWRANGARLRSLEAKGSLLTLDERRERDQIVQWFAAHDEPKPRRER